VREIVEQRGYVPHIRKIGEEKRPRQKMPGE
jgi:hypothetical protein